MGVRELRKVVSRSWRETTQAMPSGWPVRLCGNNALPLGCSPHNAIDNRLDRRHQELKGLSLFPSFH